jgi:hypothetical protein
MQELPKRARDFAIAVHGKIDHRRKYTNEPYDVHLKDVARMVGEVSDDPEVLAAAWLHDTLEDTPATYDDIEAEFGSRVATLVGELTDVSKPTDGNREVRKSIDREHLGRASADAKTVKLADIIDNCRDIVKHDPRFGRVFVAEAAALLEVLDGGHPRLLTRARKLVLKSAEKLGLPPPPAAGFEPVEAQVSPWENPIVGGKTVLRRFTGVFRASDIAEPLRSFDASADRANVAHVLEAHDLTVAGIRVDGVVAGFVRAAELAGEVEHSHVRRFGPDQIVDEDASLSDVIHVLTRHNHCFVALMGDVTGCISRAAMQRPEVRMWLFGLVTMIEMEITERIRLRWPYDEWHEFLSDGRVRKAKELQAERQRRGQKCGLLDCLQLGDKIHMCGQDAELREILGNRTRREARIVARDFESLRNNLVHAQDIITHDWSLIARIARRLEEVTRGHEEHGNF